MTIASVDGILSMSLLIRAVFQLISGGGRVDCSRLR